LQRIARPEGERPKYKLVGGKVNHISVSSGALMKSVMR
jgi:hypothetical protein